MKNLIHPQLLVVTSQVPSVSLMYLYFIHSFRYSGIADLASVKKFLKKLVHWQSLGLELGLLYPKLEIIEKEQRGDTTCCRNKMLASWLQQQDVNRHGVPTWSILKTALLEIGEH